MKALLEFDADTDAENKRGGTPLHTSGVAGTTDIAKLLIDAGAGISLVDSYGRTPLMMAAGGGHGELVDLLIQEGADVSQHLQPSPRMQSAACCPQPPPQAP